MAFQPSQLEDLPGRTIRAVVLRFRGEDPPQNQLYLVFEDDTHYELWWNYTGSPHTTTRLRPGGIEEILGRMRRGDDHVLRVYEAGEDA